MTAIRQVVVGVDLGGTATRVAVVQPAQSEAPLLRTVSTRWLVAESAGQPLAALAALITSLLEPGTELLAIGVGASGPVDRVSGVIRNQDTLPGFSDLGIVDELQAAFGVPVHLDNDAVSAALGEYHLGAGAGSARMLMVTLGTGVGAAVIDNGEPYRAADGGHPEAGHIGIGASLEVCYCGATGCWELVASRSALERASADLVPPGIHAASVVTWLGDHAAAVPRVQQCLDAYGGAVGRGLQVLRTVYGPDRIVLGGSVAAQYPRFRDSCVRAMRLTAGFDADIPVVVGTLGDVAGAVGASRMASAALAAWSPGSAPGGTVV